MKCNSSIVRSIAALVIACTIMPPAPATIFFGSSHSIPASEADLSTIESQYNIKISRENDVTSWTDLSPNNGNTEKVECRAPNASELGALQMALQHSDPSYKGKGKKSGMHVCFLRHSRAWGAHAEWGYDVDGTPTIFIEPKQKSQDELYSVLLHEFAHNSQYRMGFDKENATAWKLARKLGWQYFYDVTTNEVSWLIRTSQGLYKRIDDDRWVRCNTAARCLDAQNRRSYRRSADCKTNSEIARIAEVRPATDYFDYPWEEFAEALRLYRQNCELRQSLLSVSPDLYRLAKEHDTQELNRVYGKGTKIRTIDGLILNFSQEEEKRIFAFENSTLIGGHVHAF